MKKNFPLNAMIEYIEEHLQEDLDTEKLASIADCPAYYFQKIFFYITHITLKEYIRFRRLSLAAVELQSGNITVLEVAIKYGYDSPTAFNRAFKRFHGLAPSMAKKKNAAFKSYSPIKFNAIIQGGQTLNFQIKHKNAFRILGVSCPLDEDLETNFKTIPNRWQEAVERGIISTLMSLANNKPKGLLGVSIHHKKPWEYIIAVGSNQQNTEFEEHEIPTCMWAVFSGSGTNTSLQELERQVILEWLPTSGYQYSNLPDMEVYIKADPNDAIYEYWLPIK